MCYELKATAMKKVALETRIFIIFLCVSYPHLFLEGGLPERLGRGLLVVFRTCCLLYHSFASIFSVSWKKPQGMVEKYKLIHFHSTLVPLFDDANFTFNVEKSQ